MYRWLLCWRYLKTRYIALASVVSVMLGVATLIIVNSVMDGFTTEMQQRMHGILSDVIIESHDANGLRNSEHFTAQIKQLVGDDLEGITTVVHVPAMVSIDHRGESITRQINLVGIDQESYAHVSDFSKYLLHPDNQAAIDFALKESGYAPGRDGFPQSGWEYRRRSAAAKKHLRALQEERKALEERNRQLREQIAGSQVAGSANGEAPIDTTPDTSQQLATQEPNEFALPVAPNAFQPMANDAGEQGQTAGLAPAFDAVATSEQDIAQVFDPEVSQHEGIVLGISIASTRYRDEANNVVDYYYAQPGDDVQVTFPSSGNTPRALNEHFTVVDFYESKMSEYDSTFAFVSMEVLRKYRGMENGAVSSIQLKLKEGADLDKVRDTLRAYFPLDMMLQISTWRDLQGALLAAVQMETTILNILLFLIIAVAGFGILATFFMIVVEKTKDIGILKSLGASGSGVASIFLGYGVLLGAFGACVGAVAGLVFVANINTVADILESISGQEVFDPTVYYFETIPTIVHAGTVAWVIFGAILIAVIASVLPAIRAARMHPVEALRYE